MDEAFSRVGALLGPRAPEALRACRVAVFGLGGVGGFAAEALARSGIGALDLIDGDRVSPSNLNRQLMALRSTLGEHKVEAMGRRILDIHPGLRLTLHARFYLPHNAGDFPLEGYDFLVDAMDHVPAKAELAQRARALGIPMVSALGAGNRLDPTALRAGDIFSVRDCPLARALRRELRKRGVPSLRVVFSAETPLIPLGSIGREDGRDGRPGAPASMVFVPGAMGMALAAEAVKALLEGESLFPRGLPTSLSRGILSLHPPKGEPHGPVPHPVPPGP